MAGVAVANTIGVGDHSGVHVKVGFGVLVGGTEVTSGWLAVHPALTSTASARDAVKTAYVQRNFLFLCIRRSSLHWSRSL
jgi:hypothetical protein